MTELKTQNTKAWVKAFLDAVPDEQLRKDKTGKACLSVRTLGDIDLTVLEDLITRSVAAKSA